MPRAASKSRATGGMQAQGDRPETPLLVVVHSGKAVLPQPMPHDRQAEVVGQVTRTTRAGVVCVGMGNHGSRHRTPRIDIKIARRTEQAFIGGNDDWITHTQRRPGQSSKIDTYQMGQSKRGYVTASRGRPSLRRARVRHSRTMMPPCEQLFTFHLKYKR